jgi:serine phosphatase RsbU (regulator of sigma subunit)
VSPTHSLLGTFAESVALAILIGGLLFTLGVAFLAERLVRRRTQAEELAAANRQLYQAQRGVAETLQQSLLPQHLAQSPGLQLAVRYLPGTEGIDVGGDWYDVVRVDDGRVFFTVGDVSGRGLQAAILMASLRNAINAYAHEGHEPGVVLAKVSRLVDVVKEGRFATVVCGRIELASRVLTMANAGHLNPALLDGDGGCTLVSTMVGAPLGVGEKYAEVRVSIPPRATLVAYTDGLIERRGESIAVGLERLRQAIRANLPLEEMLDDLLATLTPSGPTDDVAVLGIRWET